MPITHGSSRKDSNRNQLDFSDERRRDGLLRSAWLQTVAGFPCRPSPRSIWDETATGDQTPWRYVISPIRAAILKAVDSGDKKLIEQTLEGARAFCRELEADFVSLVPPQEEESITAVALDETHYEGEANKVEALLLSSPTPTNADRAVMPLTRQHDRLGALIRKCRLAARVATPSMVPVK